MVKARVGAVVKRPLRGRREGGCGAGWVGEGWVLWSSVHCPWRGGRELCNGAGCDTPVHACDAPGTQGVSRARPARSGAAGCLAQGRGVSWGGGGQRQAGRRAAARTCVVLMEKHRPDSTSSGMSAAHGQSHAVSGGACSCASQGEGKGATPGEDQLLQPARLTVCSGPADIPKGLGLHGCPFLVGEILLCAPASKASMQARGREAGDQGVPGR